MSNVGNMVTWWAVTMDKNTTCLEKKQFFVDIQLKTKMFRLTLVRDKKLHFSLQVTKLDLKVFLRE